MIRVLVVDDTALTRLLFRRTLSRDAEITVVGTATDGLDALEKIETTKPDVVTLDVLMPRMDGISTLQQIMARHPLPVIMVSAITTEDAKETLKSLELGAVDIVTKDDAIKVVSKTSGTTLLAEKIKAVAKTRAVVSRQVLGRQTEKMDHPESILPAAKRKWGIISIGASTGGPKVLQEIIPRLPGELSVPVVIAQHMPAAFTGHFAERLDDLSLIDVKEGQDGESLKSGIAYLAPGGRHMRLVRRGLDTIVTVSKGREEHIYCPSVDVLMLSAAQCFPGKVLGVILTGMGSDGVKGMLEVSRTGGKVIAQSEESCVVYGMPKAIVEAGIADQVLSPDRITTEILNAIKGPT